MKAENKHSLMIWAIVVLAVMNISTLATILYHTYQSKELIANQTQLEVDTEKFSGRYFRDHLNLNSEQMDQFREFNRPFRQEARNITIELAQKRKEMIEEMAVSNSDTIRLNMLSDSIGKLHSSLKKLTYNYYLSLKNICDKEQQVKLEMLFREMFINDVPMGFPGGGMHRGMHQGRQQGKRFN
jgi:Spy/CpxP family protein refolding chaperone